jgi:hypothetical protein
MKHKKILIVGAFVAAVVAVAALIWLVNPAFCDKKVVINNAPQMINVQDYGAKGDGVHNDGPSIYKAAKASHRGTIFFPVGTYAVVQKFHMPQNVTIKGDGTTQTSLGTNNQSWLKKTKKNADGTYSWRFIWIKP